MLSDPLKEIARRLSRAVPVAVAVTLSLPTRIIDSKPMPFIVEPTSPEYIFPIEIFSIILEYMFHDNPLSMRNTALVCHDFHMISQNLTFSDITLYTRPSISKSMPDRQSLAVAVELLAQRPSLAAVNRRLAVRVPQQLSEAIPAQDFASLLESLNATKELELHYVPPTDPDHIYLTVSKNHELCGSLKSLFIRDRSMRGFNETFQEMLSSLLVLETLGLDFPLAVDRRTIQQTVVLPPSVRYLNLCWVKPYMHFTQNPPRLRMLRLDYFSCPEWSRIYEEMELSPARTTLVLHVSHTPPRTFRDNRSRITTKLQSLTIEKLIFLCAYTPIPILAYLASVLPPTVREICFDFESRLLCDSSHKPSNLHQGWEEMDSALAQRHRNGYLRRVLFRSTIHPQSTEMAQLPYQLDISVLDFAQDQLFVCGKMGIVEVDWDCLTFDPRF